MMDHKNKSVIIILLFGFCTSWETNFYESYTGHILSLEDVKEHVIRNTTFWCVNEILKCNPYESRRLDGSCNNLKQPSSGAAHTPTYRLLPPNFDTDFEPKKSKSGKPLPLCRSLRTTLLAEGRVPDTKFTQLMLHFWVFIVSDVLSIHDIVNYIISKPYCCLEKGKTDRECVPNIIPDDDPVHRFTSIRCMNLTRPMTFQSTGCVRNDTCPERILTGSPLFDLSHVYGMSLKRLNEKSRSLENGMLKFEVENGMIWPPSVKTKENVCLLNQKPKETRCHDIPQESSNSLLGINLFLIWTWRYHNFVASELSRINPCWSDDRIFFTTRDIIIANHLQMYYYELMPTVLGYENLLTEGVISHHKGFRDFYNEDVLPQISLEYPQVLRWVHTLTEGLVKMYDAKGNYLDETRIVNLTLRTGYLVDNLEFITHGSYRQPAAKNDYVVDPDMAEVGLGPLQLATDIPTSDICKNRYFGFQPYIEYRKLCSGVRYNSFEELVDVIDPERILLLKEKYEYLEDIELMTGIQSEKHVQGGHVPVTVYCVVVEQLLRTLISDRHWYERPNRPNAFNLRIHPNGFNFKKSRENYNKINVQALQPIYKSEWLPILFPLDQLLQIRKASIAQMLCSIGDGVTEIQPHAFSLPGPGNEVCSCDEIEKINFEAWKDDNCDWNQK